ncbi:MAG: hypothetical protein IJW22_05785 [Clostridia bacterium]|nr:hypothetical protein [Clostridia bacterium]
MKKSLICMLALLLASLLALGGCASHGKALFKVGGDEISVNVFQLYLSRMKGDLAAAGEKVNDADYWGSYISIDGTTYKDHYTNRVFEGLRYQAAALYLYEQEGLKLPKEELDAIDAWIEGLIQEVGEGSKSVFNSVLSAYGANITVLRDAAILEAKLEQLKVHLYGEKGAKLTATALEEYYQKTYYRGYQMLIANYYYDHDRDADGKAIYYGTDGKIAYDKENGVATDKTDKNGDTVYRYQNEDQSFGLIAYDKENGKIKYYYDDKGEHKIAYYSSEEMQERYEVLEAIAEDCKGNEERFLEYAKTYSDNAEFNDTYAPNGMYFSAGTTTSDTVFYTFSTELAKLEVGELAILESSSGYYLIMRAELDSAAWQNEKNMQWFKTLSTLTVEYMLQKKAEPYLQYVTFDEELKKSVDITMVAANNYY